MREVAKPRPESEQLVGVRLPAVELRKDLRTSQGKIPELGVGRPNSVRLTSSGSV